MTTNQKSIGLLTSPIRKRQRYTSSGEVTDLSICVRIWALPHLSDIFKLQYLKSEGYKCNKVTFLAILIF